jgi:hypothetical protein
MLGTGRFRRPLLELHAIAKSACQLLSVEFRSEAYSNVHTHYEPSRGWFVLRNNIVCVQKLFSLDDIVD